MSKKIDKDKRSPEAKPISGPIREARKSLWAGVGLTLISLFSTVSYSWYRFYGMDVPIMASDAYPEMEVMLRYPFLTYLILFGFLAFSAFSLIESARDMSKLKREKRIAGADPAAEVRP